MAIYNNLPSRLILLYSLKYKCKYTIYQLGKLFYNIYYYKSYMLLIINIEIFHFCILGYIITC